LFAGGGTSPGDVAALESLLGENHLAFESVGSAQLNAMTDAQLRRYRLLIVPGGNFITMSEQLTGSTATKIRQAVHGGMSYLGICAGAFLAADSSFYNSLKLASGARFQFYADEKRGIRKA